MENTVPNQLLEHVRGIMKTATDPDFGNRFVDLLQQIYELDLDKMGRNPNETMMIDIPVTLFALPTDKHLRLGGVGGGIHHSLTPEEIEKFNMMHALLTIQMQGIQIQSLQKRIQLYEDIVNDPDFSFATGMIEKPNA